ncbi:hypothetical protein GPECTOR_9g557 [Gonium pectorale]|uniref:Uncharacterized protein n=1 Tax=Gonium pectorale TaxID=33097 RepID=A0A150GRU9_GONPE|nr:hypothetical protein GPECTOR_9g557 [Gonium pectorale]|eukprot:KXZ52513.1 hypothetical protein GPECTOR_9g557 [Gonium pectorale]
MVQDLRGAVLVRSWRPTRSRRRPSLAGFKVKVNPGAPARSALKTLKALAVKPDAAGPICAVKQLPPYVAVPALEA